MAHLSKVGLSNEQWNETNAGLLAVGIYQDKSIQHSANNSDFWVLENLFYDAKK